MRQLPTHVTHSARGCETLNVFTQNGETVCPGWATGYRFKMAPDINMRGSRV